MARRQQRWRGLDESRCTRGIHGGYRLSPTQGISGCASSTPPSGRMEGCSVGGPHGKPFYSRHAQVPREEQLCFGPEESCGGLWTSWVHLLASGCHCCWSDQRQRLLLQRRGGLTGPPGLAMAGETRDFPPGCCVSNTRQPSWAHSFGPEGPGLLGGRAQLPRRGRRGELLTATATATAATATTAATTTAAATATAAPRRSRSARQRPGRIPAAPGSPPAERGPGPAARCSAGP